jgi:hypothetical protein
MKHKWERYKEVFNGGQVSPIESSKISLDDALYLR